MIKIIVTIVFVDRQKIGYLSYTLDGIQFINKRFRKFKLRVITSDTLSV